MSAGTMPGRGLFIAGSALCGATILAGLAGSVSFGDVPMGWLAFGLLVSSLAAGLTLIGLSMVTVARWSGKS